MHENKTTCTLCILYIVHVSGDFCFEILDTKHSPPTTNKSTYRNCFSIRFTWSGKHLCANLPCLISMNVETQTRWIFFFRFWRSLHDLLHQVNKRAKGKNILIPLINGNIFHFVKILCESTPSTKKTPFAVRCMELHDVSIFTLNKKRACHLNCLHFSLVWSVAIFVSNGCSHWKASKIH